jgi:cephalosporin-C deacetylase-like acetyl esterase
MMWLALLLLFADDFDAKLTKRAEAYWQAREQAVAELKTPRQIQQRAERARVWMLDSIGGLPDRKTPLNARVTGVFLRDGYRVENVVFESLPGFRVTANFYLPTIGPGPFPAILGVAGHSVNGKASATYQYAWIGMARRGYAVLAFDPPGQGERLETLDPVTLRSRAGVGTAEHIQAGLQCLLTGTTIARYFVHDGIRAFDYLLTRHEVDPNRIAVAGNSGGGTQAAYLAALEPRLAAAVSSCYITRWRELWSGPGPQDAEQIMPGMVSSGVDFADFALAFSPKPFLITSAIKDYFPIAGARATYQEVAGHYERLGVSQAAGFFEFDDTHGWSKPRREAAARFLDKALLGRDSDGAEPPISPDPESLLYVTPTGQLQTSFGSETVTSLNLRRAIDLYGRSAGAKAVMIEQIAPVVAKRLGIPLAVAPAVWRPGASKPGAAWNEVEGTATADGAEPVSATMYEPAAAARGTIVFAGPAADAQSLAESGWRVMSVKLRGFSGIARPGQSGYSPIYQFAARGWLLGENVPAWAVADLRTAIAAVRTLPGTGKIVLIGRDGAGVIALLTSAIEPGLAGVAMENSALSYMDYCRAVVHTGLTELVIPGVLADFDLPDIARLAASRLLVASPVTPMGAPMPPNQIPGWVKQYGGALFAERAESQTAVGFYSPWLNTR